MLRVIGNDHNLPRQEHAVASGTLTNGKAVVVNSDGTVSTATTSGSAAAVGDQSVFETGNTEWMGATFDSNSNKVVFVYKDDANSDYGTAVVGTVSGTSISFGTPVIYSSINTDSSTATFDSNSNKVVVSYYKNNVDDSYSIVGTVSGTSISFGSEDRWSTAAGVDNIATTFDSSNNKVIVVFADPANSEYGTVIVGTVSGTSITFGSEAVFQTANIKYPSCTFDTNSNKVIISYYLNSNSVQYAVVGTVSGTSISFGSPSATGITSVEGASATVYDSNSNKTVIAAKSASNYGRAVVGTVSGTSISFGTPVVFVDSAIEGGRKGPHGAFNSDLNQVAIFVDGDGFGATVYTGTVSGTSISFDSGLAITSGAHDVSDIAGIVYDTASDKLVVGYGDQPNSYRGAANVVTPDSLSTNITSENYIGIARSGAASGAGAIIDTQGAIANNLSGLTAGQSYFVQGDGTLGTTAADPSVFAGTAVSATELIVKG